MKGSVKENKYQSQEMSFGCDILVHVCTECVLCLILVVMQAEWIKAGYTSNVAQVPSPAQTKQ